MVLEDRKHERTMLDTMGAESNFHIEVYDQRYYLDKVHDISISGAGIQIPNEIEPGTPVKVVYTTSEHHISVTGRTVWCSPIAWGKEEEEDQSRFRTGIQFEPSDRNAMLFFSALRDFITPFDKSA